MVEITNSVREYFAEFGKKGGQTTARNSTPEQRHIRASKAARARWEKSGTNWARPSELGTWRGKRREYQAWANARLRCTNPEHPNYKDYGGRGIKFLFTSFEEFFAELGQRLDGMSLDRINNDGNYELGNCRWATKQVQAANRRNSWPVKALRQAEALKTA